MTCAGQPLQATLRALARVGVLRLALLGPHALTPESPSVQATA